MKFAMNAEDFKENYADVKGAPGKLWEQIKGVANGQVYNWPKSTYIAEPPFFDDFTWSRKRPPPASRGARALGIFGDSITTDHISPAGSIKESSPAGKWLHGEWRAEGRLQLLRLAPRQPRGHDARHLRQRAYQEPDDPGQADGSRVEGGITLHQPSGEQMSIYDAAMQYIARRHADHGVRRRRIRHRLVARLGRQGHAVAGREGRDRALFERIHRSNLVGMGVLPLQFIGNDSVQSLGITGNETFDLKASKARSSRSRKRPW